MCVHITVALGHNELTHTHTQTYTYAHIRVYVCMRGNYGHAHKRLF